MKINKKRHTLRRKKKSDWGDYGDDSGCWSLVRSFIWSVRFSRCFSYFKLLISYLIDWLTDDWLGSKNFKSTIIFQRTNRRRRRKLSSHMNKYVRKTTMMVMDGWVSVSHLKSWKQMTTWRHLADSPRFNFYPDWAAVVLENIIVKEEKLNKISTTTTGTGTGMTVACLYLWERQTGSSLRINRWMDRWLGGEHRWLQLIRSSWELKDVESLLFSFFGPSRALGRNRELLSNHLMRMSLICILLQLSCYVSSLSNAASLVDSIVELCCVVVSILHGIKAGCDWLTDWLTRNSIWRIKMASVVTATATATSANKLILASVCWLAQLF